MQGKSFEKALSHSQCISKMTLREKNVITYWYPLANVVLHNISTYFWITFPSHLVTFCSTYPSVPTASVQRLSGAGPRGESGGGAAGPAGEAELRVGPDEGAHVLPLLPGFRGGAGAGDGSQGPHQVGGDEQQIPEGHQRGHSTHTEHGGGKHTHTHIRMRIIVAWETSKTASSGLKTALFACAPTLPLYCFLT